MDGKQNNNQTLKFLGRVAVGVAMGFILTPIPALITGASTYLVADVVKDNIEDEDTKEIFNFISDCGKDIAIGGAIGGSVSCLVGNGTSSLASQSTKLIGQSASKEIAVNGVNTTSTALIKTGKVISYMQKNSKAVEEVAKIIINKKLKEGELEKHNDHIRNGINYVKDCAICND